MSTTSHFDLHGIVTIAVEADTPGERQLREMFRPFLVDRLAGVPDIIVGRIGPALTRPSHGEHAFRFDENTVEIVKDRVSVTIREHAPCEVRGMGELLTSVLPVVEWVGVRRGAAMVHAATVAIGGRGVLLPAWGGVGKTSTMARLTSRPDGQFMGDDWAWVNTDQELLGYAKPMFLKPHHRELYPHVFGERRKPLAPSALTDTVASLATAVHPVIIRYPRLADVTRKWSPEHLMAHPEQVFGADRIAAVAPLALVCFLERYDGTDAELTERSTDWMVRRMVGNFHAELPRTSRELVTAFGATGLIGLEDYFADKAAVTAKAIAGLPTYHLRVPADWPAPRASAAFADRVVELLG